jgi:hypothetical protein
MTDLLIFEIAQEASPVIPLSLPALPREIEW